MKRIGVIAALFVLLAPLALQATSLEDSISISDNAIGLSGAEVAGKGTVQAGEHTVYALRDPITGQVKYVGRTIDPAARAAAHAATPEKAGLTFERLKDGLTYPQARGWEQKMFEQFGGFDKLLNKINPISPKNPNLPTYLQAAQ